MKTTRGTRSGSREEDSQRAGNRYGLICGDDAPLDAFTRQLQAEEPALVVALSKPGYLEVTAGGVSKAAGLDHYARFVGLQAGDFAAISDGMNDIDMFQVAGLGVAMENAPQAVKDAADRVIGGNNSPAIAAFVREIAPVKG